MKNLIAVFKLLLLLVILLSACRQKQKSTSKQHKLKSPSHREGRKLAVNEKDKELERLMVEFDEVSNIYFGVSQFKDDYKISDFKLSGIERKEFEELLELNIDSIDVIDGREIIEFYREKLKDKLSKILEYKNIGRYDLSELFANRLVVIASDDKKLYNLVFDEKTGGSYMSQISIIHYRADDGKIYNWYDDDEPEVFDSDGYSDISNLQTKDGLKYVAYGSVKGCNSCFGEYISLLKFSNGKFVKEFQVALNTRSWEQHIGYDGKTITVDYETDDLTPNCSCNISEKSVNEMVEAEKEGTKCHCVYVFNGKTFVARK